MKKVTLKNNIKAIIREACADDAKNLIAYLNKIGGESDFLTFGENEFNISIESEEKYIQSHKDSNNSIMILTLVNDKIISVASISSNAKDRTKHIGTLGISVSKEYWGLSVGSIVMKYLIDWSKSNNITKKISLLVREDNFKAISLYQKFGFEKEGLLKKDIFVNNTYYNTIDMALFI